MFQDQTALLGVVCGHPKFNIPWPLVVSLALPSLHLCVSVSLSLCMSVYMSVSVSVSLSYTDTIPTLCADDPVPICRVSVIHSPVTLSEDAVFKEFSKDLIVWPVTRSTEQPT